MERASFEASDHPMIVCHCNVIKCQDIRSAAQDVAGADGDRVTAGRVFKALGEAPNCARCVPLMTSVIHDAITTGAAGCAGCACPTEQDLAPAAATAVGDIAKVS
ncbi:MAG: hypothetical protein AAF213_00600 [Pseudomonadota bacterium]